MQDAVLDAHANGNNQLMKPKSNIACVLKPTFASPMHMGPSPKSSSKYCFSFFTFCWQFAHFFLPPPLSASSFFSQEITFPSITTPLPSINATRDRPSQFLKVSHTNGCCGWKEHSAISLLFKLCGSSIFFPPVSLPIFHFNLEMRQAERPQRTKPIGEYPTLISFGMSSTWICASNSFVCPRVVSFLYTITSPDRGMLFLSRPLMLRPTLSPGFAKSTRWWCISTVKTLPVHGLDAPM